MPSRWIVWMMLTLVGSWLIGALFYYVVAPHRADEKRKRIDDVASTVINVVLYMWLLKLIIHVQTFVRDPLAILAYPSDRRMFYGGIVLAVLTLLVQAARKKQSVERWFVTFVPIAFVASFSYEWLLIAQGKGTYTFPYVALVGIAIGTYLVGVKRSEWGAAIASSFIWLIGMLWIQQTMMPVVTLFSYRVTGPVIGALTVALMIGIVRKKGRD